MIAIALFLATCFLAYSNGANDNFKGVASLFGCKAASYRTAITWATLTTFAGSIAAIFLAQALLKKFSGKGLVPDAIVGSPQFLLAVAIGAALTVILATRFGFPISTTHGLMGAIIGSGLVAVGGAVNFAALGKGIRPAAAPQSRAGDPAGRAALFHPAQRAARARHNEGMVRLRGLRRARRGAAATGLDPHDASGCPR